MTRAARGLLGPAAVVLALLGVGGAVRSGALPLPGIERLEAALEPDLPARRPGPEFYRLPPTERLRAAWEYADAGDVERAAGACTALLSDRMPPEIEAEALFLRASLAARYLDRPWHAAADLRRYLGLPGGGRRDTARLLLAEIYLALDRPRPAARLLSELSGRGAAALADLAGGATRPEAPGGWRFLPNNLVSLGLWLVGVGAMAVPSFLKFAMREAKKEGIEDDPARALRLAAAKLWRSRVRRTILLVFLAALTLQWGLNQYRHEKSRRVAQELRRALAADPAPGGM